MREIKFRAWSRFEDDNGNDMWAMDEHVAVSLNGKAMTIDGLELDDSILMQYTGLKDKNGVDIYEGDILRHPDFDYNENSIEVVKFNYGCFSPFDSDSVGYQLASNEQKFCSELEVIGNIHENPELLQ